jgi:hypothetical protein
MQNAVKMVLGNAQMEILEHQGVEIEVEISVKIEL